jgi:hypothetical protein
MKKMINLLPQEQKNELLNQSSLRLVFVLGALFLSFLLSFSLILILVKNYFLLSIQNEKILFEEKQKIVSLYENTEKEMIAANSLFADILSVYQEQYPLTETLHQIHQTFPPGTYLENFSFIITEQKTDEGTETQAKLALIGVCPNRDLLLELKDNLEKQTNFSKVYFSPNSWVEPTEPTFSVGFELN